MSCIETVSFLNNHWADESGNSFNPKEIWKLPGVIFTALELTCGYLPHMSETVNAEHPPKHAHIPWPRMYGHYQHYKPVDNETATRVLTALYAWLTKTVFDMMPAHYAAKDKSASEVANMYLEGCRHYASAWNRRPYEDTVTNDYRVTQAMFQGSCVLHGLLYEAIEGSSTEVSVSQLNQAFVLTAIPQSGLTATAAQYCCANNQLYQISSSQCAPSTRCESGEQACGSVCYLPSQNCCQQSQLFEAGSSQCPSTTAPTASVATTVIPTFAPTTLLPTSPNFLVPNPSCVTTGCSTGHCNCGGACYLPSQYWCFNATLMQGTALPATSSPTTISTTHAATVTVTPTSSVTASSVTTGCSTGHCNCGGGCYDPSQYWCSGITLMQGTQPPSTPH